MVFGRKKRGMIDIRELVRRGRVRKETDEVPDFNVNKDGFVDMGHPSNASEKGVAEHSVPVHNSGLEQGGDFMDFLNVGGSGDSASDTGDGYSKREVDSHIQKLDSMIYKLEQRIELLERKAGVGDSGSNSGVGAMGW